MKEAWVEKILKLCRKADVAFFFKQCGGILSRPRLKAYARSSQSLCYLSLNRFIESVYFPYAEQQKRRSPYRGYRNLWKRYIQPNGERALREYRTFDCEQMMLSSARQEDLCRTSLGHIKHCLSGVFRDATTTVSARHGQLHARGRTPQGSSGQ